MYIVVNKVRAKSGKTYRTVLLRESYREGKTVRNRTIANLSACSPAEVEAMRLALKHKDDLSALGSVRESMTLREGPSIGAIWAVYQVARRQGVETALGTDVMGKLALWQVIARVIEQGSRLSAVRLAQTQAACEVLCFARGFDENDLYDNLKWLSAHQTRIEDRLFAGRGLAGRPRLFLYDVTSSYLEGQMNALADYGYNRDGKKGKKQIVVGLLCDETGEPIATEVFRGNTQDTRTFASQVRKVAERFGCERVTFVGDRGMIKSGQLETLGEAGFHFITAITKSQIEALIKRGVIQPELFDEALCEVEHDGLRYVLRRNLQRVGELATTRQSKREAVAALVKRLNEYLEQHPRATTRVALAKVRAKTARLRIDKWLTVRADGRMLRLATDAPVLAAVSRLDGCYVIKTDLPSRGRRGVPCAVIHDRYKDLAEVEQGFRTYKTDFLEVRPVYVRTVESTQGHVLVVMLA
ncbi:MAG: IS1634 family transposase, partial [Gemmatimonadales bacterium]|nr:IS1634 family transposase [Gemmatimonadales bacterium]